jgi:hypothetical protein
MMGHYAKVINSVVIEVIVADQEFIDTLPDKWAWVQTSYNMRGGIYYDNATGLPAADQFIELEAGRKRKNYAGIGYRYDSEEMRLFHRHRTQVGNSTRTHVYGKHRFLTQAITSNTYGTKRNKNGLTLAIILKMAS